MQKADEIVAEVEAAFRSPNDSNLTAENMTSAQVYEEIFELIRQNKQYEVFLTPGEEFNDSPVIGVRQLERTYSTETAIEQLRSSDYFEFMSKDELANFKNNAMNISPQKDDFFQSQEYLDLIGFDEGSSGVLDVLSNGNDDLLDTNNTNKINNNNLKSGDIMEVYAGKSLPFALRNDYALFMK